MNDYSERAQAYISAYPNQVASLSATWKATGGTADELRETIEELAAMELPAVHREDTR